MIDNSALLQLWRDQPWHDALQAVLADMEQFQQRDRKSRAYAEAIAAVPPLPAAAPQLDRDQVTIGTAAQLTAAQHNHLQQALFALRPWRKGPFNLYGIEIDSEWVSALKWQRLQGNIAPLRGRRVLDVGSSCGYYLLRMQAEQPRLLVGLEPYATFYYQFCLLQRLFKIATCFTLPLKFEQMPLLEGYFDSVFHMGVLYHVKSPLDTLVRLRRTLRRGGELVLETLVIPGDEYLALAPPQRYAKMNNVYFIPTVNCLQAWLERSGFTNVRCVDVTRTTGVEQRKTAWIQTESLADFLDPDDEMKTVEGYPAPRRALMLAEVK